MHARDLLKFRLRTYDEQGKQVAHFTHHDLDYILELLSNDGEHDAFIDIIWRDMVIFTESRSKDGQIGRDAIIRYLPGVDELDDGAKLVGG